MIKNNVPHLILTVDYELFGNGTGCIEHCVVKPAELMLSVADKFDAKLTFFVEVMEFIAMGCEPGFRYEVEYVRQQLVRAIRGNHDAQLHLHPQWSSAKYLPDGKWGFDGAHWRLGDLGSEDVDKYLQIGKKWLEGLLQPTMPDYKCIAFRAGGWCIQPSEIIVKKLQRYGFKVESTVAPGMRNLVRGAWSNFTQTPTKGFWLINGNVCIESKQGIWEIPIVTGSISPNRHFKVLKNTIRTENHGLALGCYGNYQGTSGRFQSLFRKAWRLLYLGHVMLDFSTMPSDVLVDTTKQWLERYSSSGFTVPIVAIAHTKNFTETSVDSLLSYLEWAKSNNIEFSTYPQWLKTINA